MIIFIIIVIVIILACSSNASNSNNTNNNHEKSDNKSIYSDEELNAYGLLDEEKELVKKGEYDPWQFEEDEMDEDDYYYD